VYTLHTRILVRSPSGYSWPFALLIFGVGVAGVLLNFWADSQRMIFREKNGKCLIWGKPPKFIKASYQVDGLRACVACVCVCACLSVSVPVCARTCACACICGTCEARQF
jgi:7-dehydrocholesterol reductase